MQRREALRLIGTAAAIPALGGLSAERLWGLAQDTHDRADAFSRSGLGVLDPHQLETIATIGDIILPRTDTPGARDVGVPAFIDLLMTEWYDDTERAQFLTGLAAIDADAAGAGGGARDFISLRSAAQLALVGKLDIAEARPAGSAVQAFRTIKQLTVFGYFTSRPVQRDVLKVNIWPGRYDGCVPA